MDDADAVEALKRLGLDTYEARVFVALQKLGSGSASEVSEVSDVPRSQVYGAAEGLEGQGLVDVQQGTPTRYRPIGLSEAKAHLLDRLESEGERAFDYLGDVQGAVSAGGERSESIWIVEGADSVVDRTAQVVADAGERVVYAPPDETRLEPAVADALEERAAAGVRVTVVVPRGTELDVEDSPVETSTVPDLAVPDVRTGRLVLVDDDAVLLSVLPAPNAPHLHEETAFWSEETAFAQLLVAVFEQWIASLVADYDPDR